MTLFKGIPWSSDTVRAALVGIIGAWLAYFLHTTGSDGTQLITLSGAASATWAGAMAIYFRRSNGPATYTITTTEDKK